MTKALVVNGLNRSGTTMTERIIDSQPDMMCFTLVFQMLKMIVQLRGLSDKGEIMGESFADGRNVLTARSRRQLRLHLIMDYVSVVYGLADHEYYARQSDDTVWGLTRGQLFEILEAIATHEAVEDIASLLEAIGERLSLRVVGTRWTAHHRFAPAFLSNGRGYWLEVVRNPYARFSSERLSHGAHLAQALFHMDDNFRFAGLFRHERYRVVRYEDICNDTDKCLAGISEWLGEEIKNVDLVNPLGGPFRPNTSDNVSGDRDLYYQDATVPARIGALDEARWRARISGRDIALINRAVDFAGFYDREPVPSWDDCLAGLQLAHLRGVSRAKDVARSALRPFGYTIRRLPEDRPL